MADGVCKGVQSFVIGRSDQLSLPNSLCLQLRVAGAFSLWAPAQYLHTTYYIQKRVSEKFPMSILAHTRLLTPVAQTQLSTL